MKIEATRDYVTFVVEAEDVHVEYAGCGTHELSVAVRMDRFTFEMFLNMMRNYEMPSIEPLPNYTPTSDPLGIDYDGS